MLKWGPQANHGSTTDGWDGATMITITQNKVAGFEPRWAPFAGFSVLFDNPGDSLAMDGGLSRVACAPAVGGPLDLYARIGEAMDKLDRDLLIRTYLFCPLPPSSYHVTVWDGINVDNIGSVRPPVRSDWSEFLEGLPSTLTAPPASMAVVTGSALKTWSGSISFQFEKLVLWGNQVLVARLRPTEGTSEQSLVNLSSRRTELSEAAGHDLGCSFSRGYSPHVSLGYFANREHGQLAETRIEHWTERFRIGLRDSIITYSSLDVYGFTDMASFFRVTTSGAAA